MTVLVKHHHLVGAAQVSQQSDSLLVHLADLDIVPWLSASPHSLACRALCLCPAPRTRAYVLLRRMQTPHLRTRTHGCSLSSLCRCALPRPSCRVPRARRRARTWRACGRRRTSCVCGSCSSTKRCVRSPCVLRRAACASSLSARRLLAFCDFGCDSGCASCVSVRAAWRCAC